MTNGAELLIAQALELGLDTCFANPGTTELPMVLALDSRPGLRSVLGLHENVCSGAADGYARIAGKPAMTILHLGPGFANSIANQHNARRAFSPVINFVGEHASWHIAADPPLNSDIESLARPVSAFVRRSMSAGGIPRDLREAHASAISRRGSVSTLILPHDHLLASASEDTLGPCLPRTAYPQLDDDSIEQAARLLDKAQRPAMLIGGNALHGAGLAAAGRTGVTLIAEGSFARLETGRGRPFMLRLPYFPDQAKAMLDRFDAVVVCGTKLPVSFFGYDDHPSRYLDGRDDVVQIAGADDDAVGAMQALAERLRRKGLLGDAPEIVQPSPGDALTTANLADILTMAMPEDAISVVTAVSSAADFYTRSAAAAPHTQIALTGGAIGEGSALSLGAAVAGGGRPVVALEADGSAAYIVQALYSHAREGLDITTVICSNRRYNILDVEVRRAGVQNAGPHTRSLADLGQPPIDWVSLARGFGVQASRATTVEELDKALRRGIAEPGPSLIEAVI
ncbi:MAG: acetolactate synthase large subunit [Geminicoccaceae bacterium]|nr:acetolactate synthase large subunit [Geminicoccaceae bacterium]MCB9945201.1 acetolactate synthase large subunit [Geminicoccaceae bacterium]